MTGGSGGGGGVAVEFSYSGLLRAADQVIADNTDTLITFDTNSPVETGGNYFDAGTPERIIIPATAIYSVTGFVYFPENNTPGRYVYIQINGLEKIALVKGGLNGAAFAIGMLPFSVTRRFVAGDYLTLRCLQTSGGNLTVTPFMIIRKVRG